MALAVPAHHGDAFAHTKLFSSFGETTISNNPECFEVCADASTTTFNDILICRPCCHDVFKDYRVTDIVAEFGFDHGVFVVLARNDIDFVINANPAEFFFWDFSSESVFMEKS